MIFTCILSILYSTRRCTQIERKRGEGKDKTKQGEVERGRERQTKGQTEREIEREKGRETHRGRERERYGDWRGSDGEANKEGCSCGEINK